MQTDLGYVTNLGYTTTGYIGNLIIHSFIYILLIAIYTYILKLEKSGCSCAEHPYQNFIKGYSIFSFIFLLFTMFITPKIVAETFGEIFGILYTFLVFVFFITFILYLFYTLEYTRYLINEKCKCSEDFRREFIMVGVTFDLIILVLILLTIILLPIVLVSMNSLYKNVNTFEEKVESAIRDPIASIRSIPGNVNKTVNMTKNIVKSSLDVVEKVAEGPKKFRTVSKKSSKSSKSSRPSRSASKTRTSRTRR